MASATVRFLAMYGPILGVAVVSGLYLWDCIEEVQSPGTGFKIDYATPAGPLNIACNQYSLDLLGGNLVANGVVIRHPDGKIIARLPKLVAQGLSPGAISPKVLLQDPSVWIRRTKDNKLDLQQYFPPSDDEPSDVPFQIDIRQGRVNFIDEASKGVPVDQLLVESAQVAGAGPDLMGSISLKLDQNRAATEARIDKNIRGTTVNLKLRSADLSAIQRRVLLGPEGKRWFNLADVKLARATASGTALIHFPSKGDPTYTVNLTTTGTGIGWQQYTAGSILAKIQATEKGLRVEGEAMEKGATAKFDLRGLNAKQFEWGGEVSATNITPAFLSGHKIQLPNQLKFGSVNLNGTITGIGSKIDFRGPVQVQNVSASGVSVPRIEVMVAANPAAIQAQISHAKLGSTKLAGFVTYDLSKSAWSLAAETPDIHAKDFAKLLPSELKGIHGPATIVGSGRGKQINLLADAAAYGSLEVAGRRIEFGGSPITVAFDGKKATIKRATLEGPHGAILASGSYDLQKGFNISLSATGVPLSTFQPDLTGTGDVSGRLTGTVSAPLFTGDVQLATPGLKDSKYRVTALTAKVRATPRQVAITDIFAVRGTSEIRGSLALNPTDLKVDGTLSASNINVTDYVDVPVTGIADAEQIRIGGTAKNLSIQGKLSSRSLVANSARFTDVKSDFAFKDRKVTASGGSANLLGGKLAQIDAVYDLGTKIGQLKGEFADLDVNQIRETIEEEQDKEILSPQFLVNGKLGGKIEARLNKSGLESLTASGDLGSVQLNEAILGGGTWNTSFNGQKWTADAMIGSIEDYLQLSNLTYGTKSRVISGNLSAYNVPIKQLIQAAQPLFANNPDTREKLNLIDGKLNLSAQVGGLVDDPNLDLTVLEADGLTLDRDPVGALKFSGFYSKDLWKITNGVLEGPKTNKFFIPFGKLTLPESKAIADGSATFQASQTASEVSARVNVGGFKLNRFASLVPALKGLGVQVDYGEAILTGSPEAPELKARIESSLAPTGKTSNEYQTDRLSAVTDLLAKGTKGSDSYQVEQTTKLSYNALQALLTAKAHVPKQGGSLDSQPFSGRAELVGVQNLNSFLTRIPNLKIGEVGATAQGGFDLSGTFGDPVIRGQIALNLDQAVSNARNPVIGGPINVGLKNAEFKFGLEGQGKSIVASILGKTGVTTSENGEVSFNAKADLTDIISGNRPFSEFLQTPIKEGAINLSELFLVQRFPEGGFVQAQFSTPEPIKLGGTLEKPRLTGDLAIARLSTSVPVLKPVAGSDEPPAIDPTLNLNFTLSNTAFVRASTAEMSLRGAGSISGSLSRLIADANLTIESGELALPGGRVRMVPDGTIDFTYRADKEDAKAKLLANMKGTTSLTMLKNGVTPERYDVTIDISGDMLSPTGLTLNTTEQGDLTKDKVLAMLGRTDLLNSVLQPGSNQQIEEDLRNAITSFSLPTFLGGITNRIAENLGFEYVSVDYNSFEQASISAARSLGSGFFLQGRRQLLPPLPGQPIAYDFRLAYRPRGGPRAFQNVSFALGTDHILPYKFNIDYSTKVRTSNPPYRSYVWSVPPKERR